MPELESRFHQQFKDQGLEVIAIASREPLDQIGLIEDYCENLGLTYLVGVESPNTTYTALVRNYQGGNPFPLSAIVDKNGIIRYAAKEYDPDAQEEVVRQLLME